MIRRMGKDDFNGPMDKFMMGNGSMTKSMEADNGRQKMVFLLWVNGSKTRFRVLAY